MNLYATPMRAIIASMCLALVFTANAKEYEGKSNNSNTVNTRALSKMAECNPPISYTEFGLNNVRFGLEAGGQLWTNPADDAAYSVPKVDLTTGEIPVHSLYGGGLWLGGYSPDGQLKLAAVTYRQNGTTDYYTGPLSIDNFATADFCSQYDRHFFANLTDAQRHRSFFSSSEEDREELFPDGYSIPDYFFEWPAQNEEAVSLGLPYAEFLAPFVDLDGDGEYNPSAGDYPGYDLLQEVDCRTRDRRDPVPLFGDETLWWVFNDNGGPHTQTGGQPIGIEIQAQAFAYNTTDEVNNMTFYNYTLINRGTQTLERTYMGQWVDSDVGCPNDDYVGCDVERGLGFSYNGTDDDASCQGIPGYGANPPAVGVDFFEGPFQDDDGINNPLTSDLGVVEALGGIPYSGIGIGYFDTELDVDDPFQDNIVDNERFGMRRFVYYNITGQGISGINDEPQIAIDFYNYLDGRWKNNELMTYGGNGVGGSIPTNYMFPGTSDPLGYATDGAVTNDEWTEETEGNEPADRRFVQSAGTFILDPGEFNNITVGVVWSRPFSDVDRTLNALVVADEKAQALFDNCFRIISGPDAPDMTAQELDREVILYLSNENPISNNFEESYGFPSTFAFDPNIPTVDLEGAEVPTEDRYYEFQGYQIYQLKNANVSSAELDNPDLARLAFQVDKEDNITQIVNYLSDPELGFNAPVLEVNGENEGLRSSFRATRDLFATGDDRLVNFQKYYYMAVAYAHNNWTPYNSQSSQGQAEPYLVSRKSAVGAVPVITVIPHKPLYEQDGTVLNVDYGFTPEVTRLEGEGNGGLAVDIKDETHDAIMASEFNMTNELQYEANAAPVAIQVVDPINVQEARFELRLFPDTSGVSVDFDDLVDDWEITDPSFFDWALTVYDVNDQQIDFITSNRAIDVGGEQLVLKYGISINMTQIQYVEVLDSPNEYARFIESSIEYDNPDLAWFAGVPDLDTPTEQNWIRSGAEDNSEDPTCEPENPQSPCYYDDYLGVDPDEVYEDVLGGTISPWHVAGEHRSGPADGTFNGTSLTPITDLNNVDIHFTSNKERWTRVPVLEIQSFPQLAAGGGEKLFTRIALSVDRNGLNQAQGGDFDQCTVNGTQLMTQDQLDDLTNEEIRQHKLAIWPTEDPDNRPDEVLLDYSFGFGWFPGYAIDVERGERLNMAFGENSGLGAQNGRDMIWNPTDQLWNPFNGNQFDPTNARFGGMHYFYVFRNENRDGERVDRMPQYDNGQYAFYNINASSVARRGVFRACTWVGLPLLTEGQSLLTAEEGLIPTDTKIRVRVEKKYKRAASVADIYDQYLYEDEDDPWSQAFPTFYWEDESGVLDPDDFDAGESTLIGGATVSALEQSQNDWYPLYTFDTEGLGAVNDDIGALQEGLKGINVVPNPYYGGAAGSNYEELSRLDIKVKIINLPERCIIRIYNTSGTLVRTFDKDSPTTELNWDLKNERNVPIAGGVYIVHIEVPGVGETIVKWFGALRPIDLDNF